MTAVGICVHAYVCVRVCMCVLEPKKEREAIKVFHAWNTLQCTKQRCPPVAGRTGWWGDVGAAGCSVVVNWHPCRDYTGAKDVHSITHTHTHTHTHSTLTKVQQNHKTRQRSCSYPATEDLNWQCEWAAQTHYQTAAWSRERSHWPALPVKCQDSKHQPSHRSH